MVQPPATVGLGLCSAAIHDVSDDFLFTALELSALNLWLVRLAKELDCTVTDCVSHVKRVLTLRDGRLRSKQRVPEDWMMKERGAVDVQPQEEQSERATTATTAAALHEQQHQMPSHVQIFIPDWSRRIKIVPPKPPREKKEAIFKGRGTGKCTFCGLVQSDRNHRYFCDQAPWEYWCKGVQIRSAKSTRTDRETQ